jgi:repressor LexA
MGIGLRIREAREREGLTQRELGQRVGVTPSAIANYENGVSHPKEAVLYRLMAALRVDANYLYQDGAAAGATLSPAERAHLDRYRALDCYGRDMVDTVLRKEHARAAARGAVLTLPFFQDKVSAGLGNFVGNSRTEQLSIRLLPETSGSDYVVQVTGDSMEPEFRDGDLILVHSQPEVDVGEIGLWILNGDGYIKQRGQEGLLSLNPRYAPIPIGPEDSVQCCGKVLRRLKSEWIL